MTDDLVQLAQRLNAGETGNNLDVLIEVALFEPDDDQVSARANAARTKVIYSDPYGRETTHLAPSWTKEPAQALTAIETKIKEFAE